ncbi:MAG: TadE/TadG family type IV pilus assembly protein [Rhizobiaceae bacterium]
MIFDLLVKLARDRGGNFAIITAIVAPALLGMGGLATDYAMLYQRKAELQNLADAAALASTKELSIASMKDAEIEAVADEFVTSNFSGAIDGTITKLDITATVTPRRDGVDVTLSYEWAPIFAQLFDAGVTPIVTKASAQLAGQGLSCVLGLMPPQRMAKSSIHLEHRAVLKADNCSVYANTDHAWAIRLDGNSKMTASTICSAGGVLKIGSPVVSPAPVTDCPLIEDPLSLRAAPSYGNCDENALVITANTVLDPGVYCGGLTVKGPAKVTLRPGLYIIKEGKLAINNGASLAGVGVGFFLTGDNSLIEFAPSSSIDLAAPESGPLAGLLFYEDRNVNYSFDFNPLMLYAMPSNVRLHKIKSNNARNLLGTIYLPRSVLLIDAEAPVADASAYTAIVTGRLWLQQGPKLVLNANYSDTRVPVPGGLLGTVPRLVN